MKFIPNDQLTAVQLTKLCSRLNDKGDLLKDYTNKSDCIIANGGYLDPSQAADDFIDGITRPYDARLSTDPYYFSVAFQQDEKDQCYCKITGYHFGERAEVIDMIQGAGQWAISANKLQRFFSAADLLEACKNQAYRREVIQ